MASLRRLLLGLAAPGWLLCVALPPSHAVGPPPGPAEQPTAARVDAALRKANGPRAAVPPPADDATFLRRASLDLTGHRPTPEELRRWSGDRSPDKRARLV